VAGGNVLNNQRPKTRRRKVKIEKQVLAEAVIEWMRYKRDLVKIPAYCNAAIEEVIRAWDYDTLKQVVCNISLGNCLFSSYSCPFCVAYDGGCVDCEFRLFNGNCNDIDSLWRSNSLGERYTRDADREKFNSIFMSQEIYFWEGDRQRIERLTEAVDQLSTVIEKLEAIPTTPGVDYAQGVLIDTSAILEEGGEN
jgi:hypothetical protein